MGGTDFSGVIAKIKAAKRDVIYSTLNGDSNVAFFKQKAAAGMKPDVQPLMSFSIGEQEAQARGPALVEGSYTGWNHLQRADTPGTKKSVETSKLTYRDATDFSEPRVHGTIDG